MAHTITIETQSENDFALLKGLAQRLGLAARESHTGNKPRNEEDSLRLLERVAGSWEGEETGDELNAIIRNSRYDSPRKSGL